MFALAEALRENPLGDKAAQGELALACVRAGLAALDRACGQVTLGNAYAERMEGERAANLEAALEAYQRALTVRTRAAFPVQWAITTYNLALLYADLGSAARRRGDLEGCRRYREEAVSSMRDARRVYGGRISRRPRRRRAAGRAPGSDVMRGWHTGGWRRWGVMPGG